jgi:hypothetical protein
MAQNAAQGATIEVLQGRIRDLEVEKVRLAGENFQLKQFNVPGPTIGSA